MFGTQQVYDKSGKEKGSLQESNGKMGKKKLEAKVSLAGKEKAVKKQLEEGIKAVMPLQPIDGCIVKQII